MDSDDNQKRKESSLSVDHPDDSHDLSIIACSEILDNHKNSSTENKLEDVAAIELEICNTDNNPDQANGNTFADAESHDRSDVLGDDFDLPSSEPQVPQDASQDPVIAVGSAESEVPRIDDQADKEQTNNPEEIFEEEEEDDKFENTVEAKDFLYFKRQWKLENFVNQLGTNSQRSKTQSALYSYFGHSLQETSCEAEKEEADDSKPMVGFDTRFTYTREGLMVYDINSEIEMDAPNEENKGISIQDYNVFKNATPANEYDKNTRHDYYQKFKSYRNALAPFSGLEFATDHERKVYEFLPPFK